MPSSRKKKLKQRQKQKQKINIRIKNVVSGGAGGSGGGGSFAPPPIIRDFTRPVWVGENPLGPAPPPGGGGGGRPPSPPPPRPPRDVEAPPEYPPDVDMPKVKQPKVKRSKDKPMEEPPFEMAPESFIPAPFMAPAPLAGGVGPRVGDMSAPPPPPIPAELPPQQVNMSARKQIPETPDFSREMLKNLQRSIQRQQRFTQQRRQKESLPIAVPVGEPTPTPKIEKLPRLPQLDETPTPELPLVVPAAPSVTSSGSSAASSTPSAPPPPRAPSVVSSLGIGQSAFSPRISLSGAIPPGFLPPPLDLGRASVPPLNVPGGARLPSLAETIPYLDNQPATVRYARQREDEGNNKAPKRQAVPIIEGLSSNVRPSARVVEQQAPSVASSRTEVASDAPTEVASRASSRTEVASEVPTEVASRASSRTEIVPPSQAPTEVSSAASRRVVRPFGLFLNPIPEGSDVASNASSKTET